MVFPSSQLQIPVMNFILINKLKCDWNTDQKTSVLSLTLPLWKVVRVQGNYFIHGKNYAFIIDHPSVWKIWPDAVWWLTMLITLQKWRCKIFYQYSVVQICFSLDRSSNQKTNTKPKWTQNSFFQQVWLFLIKQLAQGQFYILLFCSCTQEVPSAVTVIAVHCLQLLST